MHRNLSPLLGFTIALSAVACTKQTASVEAAAKALNVAEAKSIEYSGTGSWYQFGQAPNPLSPWPQFDVSSYTADINYDTASARVQIVRKQTIEPGRERPAPVEQKPDQYISGTLAWNVAVPNNSPPGTAAVPSLQLAAVEERSAEIWSTPHGFLKAAAANKARSKPANGGTEVSFTNGGKYRYVGTINAKYEVETVKTWIDNPILGDTLIETQFSEYRDFGGVKFPAHIVRTQGGYPVLDLKISSVKLNPPVAIPVPDEIADARSTPVNVVSTELAKGVYYLTGGSHHSVAIEQQDHVVLVEAPQNEERSLAVITKVKEALPGKPIKFLVNSHAHFDHSGGLRTYVDEGATIVTHKQNQAYFEQAWAAPRTINPDKLAASKKPARFETFTDRHVLSDGKRSIEIHQIAGNGHNDAFALVYLPAEKILIEADAYTPLPTGAPAPTAQNPYSVNLYENIQKLNLDVDQIAALHGPAVVKLAALQAVIGQN